VRTGRRDWLWAVTFLVIAIAVIAVMVMVLMGGSDPDEPEIAGIPCESSERLDYHVHATLSVIIDGEPQRVPTNVGVKPGECIYWLHTHDDQGLIHVEAPEEGSYTLGQFFAIWGQSLSETQLLDRTTDADTVITATVNGETFEGDPAEISLADGDVVVVELGPANAPA
jgi:hypothetical protein